MAGLLSLPGELFESIVHEFEGDPLPLAALAQCSRASNTYVVPWLYRRLVLTRRNAARLFHGLRRDAPPKRRNMTKREWDAQLDEFARANKDELELFRFDGDYDYDQVENVPWSWDDSDPETDDELAPPHASVAKTWNEASWKRRLELLAHCQHLTVLQVPSRPIVSDLVAACGITIPSPRAWTTLRAYFDHTPEQMLYGSCGAECCDDVDDTPQDTSGVTQLFPNLVNLVFGERAVQYISSWNMFPYEAGKGLVGDRGLHPFLYLVKNAFGAPTNICITSASSEPDVAVARHGDGGYDFALPAREMFRWLKPEPGGDQRARRGDIAKAGQLLCGLALQEAGMGAQAVVDGLPCSATSITVHGILYPGLHHWYRPVDRRFFEGSFNPALTSARTMDAPPYSLPIVKTPTASVSYRYFYDGYSGLTMDERAGAILWALRETAPTPAKPWFVSFEHIDVGSGEIDPERVSRFTDLRFGALVKLFLEGRLYDTLDVMPYSDSDIPLTEMISTLGRSNDGTSSGNGRVREDDRSNTGWHKLDWGSHQVMLEVHAMLNSSARAYQYRSWPRAYGPVVDGARRFDDLLEFYAPEDQDAESIQAALTGRSAWARGWAAAVRLANCYGHQVRRYRAHPVTSAASAALKLKRHYEDTPGLQAGIDAANKAYEEAYVDHATYITAVLSPIAPGLDKWGEVAGHRGREALNRFRLADSACAERYAERRGVQCLADALEATSPDPRTRISFTNSEDAAPCVVCGGCRAERGLSLRQMVDAAWRI